MNFDLEKAIPHRAPMVLIDKVLDVTAEKLLAEVVIRETSFGYENGAVPAWFGVEYMAQSIAAYNGIRFAKPGGKPEIGFLVGVRGYDAKVSEFKLGTRLEISVVPNFIADSAGSFSCQITIEGESIGEAVITTFKPDAAFIQKLKDDHHE